MHMHLFEGGRGGEDKGGHEAELHTVLLLELVLVLLPQVNQITHVALLEGRQHRVPRRVGIHVGAVHVRPKANKILYDDEFLPATFALEIPVAHLGRDNHPQEGSNL